MKHQLLELWEKFLPELIESPEMKKGNSKIKNRKEKGSKKIQI